MKLIASRACLAPSLQFARERGLPGGVQRAPQRPELGVGGGHAQREPGAAGRHVLVRVARQPAQHEARRRRARLIRHPGAGISSV